MLPGRREKWSKVLNDLEDQGFISRDGRQITACLPGTTGKFDDETMTIVAKKGDPIWGQNEKIKSNGPKWGPQNGAKTDLEVRDTDIDDFGENVSVRKRFGREPERIFYSRRRVLTESEKDEFDDVPSHIKSVIDRTSKGMGVDLRPKRNWSKGNNAPRSLPRSSYVVEPDE